MDNLNHMKVYKESFILLVLVLVVEVVVVVVAAVVVFNLVYQKI